MKAEERAPSPCPLLFYYIRGVACDVFVDPFKVPTFVLFLSPLFPFTSHLPLVKSLPGLSSYFTAHSCFSFQRKPIISKKANHFTTSSCLLRSKTCTIHFFGRHFVLGDISGDRKTWTGAVQILFELHVTRNEGSKIEFFNPGSTFAESGQKQKSCSGLCDLGNIMQCTSIYQVATSLLKKKTFVDVRVVCVCVCISVFCVCVCVSTWVCVCVCV